MADDNNACYSNADGAEIANLPRKFDHLGNTPKRDKIIPKI